MAQSTIDLALNALLAQHLRRQQTEKARATRARNLKATAKPLTEEEKRVARNAKSLARYHAMRAATAHLRPKPEPSKPRVKLDVSRAGTMKTDPQGVRWTNDRWGRRWNMHQHEDKSWTLVGPERMVAASDGKGLVRQVARMRVPDRRAAKRRMREVSFDISRYYALRAPELP